jgi:hypothetical protein
MTCCRRILALLILVAVSSPAPGAAQEILTSNLVRSEDVEGPKVDLRPELEAFFGGIGCTLPKTLTKKLEKERKAGFIPGDVTNALGDDLKRQVQKAAQTGIRPVLHDVRLMVGAEETTVRVQGSSTYETLDPTQFIDGSSFDNVAYLLDCSGYLTASISAGGGVPAGEIKAAADVVVTAQKSALVIRAYVFTPVALALNPDLSAKGLAEIDRLDVLAALLAAVRNANASITDAAKVKAPLQLKLLWLSNQGSSSAQGRASLGASGGIAFVSGKIETGASISRALQFSKFDTYYFPDFGVKPVQMTVGDIRAALVAAVARVRTEPKANRKTIDVAVSLPKNLCRLTWEALAASADTSVATAVQSSWDEKGCTITVTPVNEELFKPGTGFRLRGKGAETPATGVLMNVLLP